jgi:hypothetical protein
MKASPSSLRGLAAALFLGLTSAGFAMSGEMPGAQLHQSDGIKWKAGPGSLEQGAQFAVLEGDPAKEGPFVMRIKVPHGFQIRPHTHPKVERVTVISGTFVLAMGEKLDRAHAVALKSGAYGYWQPGMVHTAWAEGETVVQLHGIGPWIINYVNPADDPRLRNNSPIASSTPPAASTPPASFFTLQADRIGRARQSEVVLKPRFSTRRICSRSARSDRNQPWVAGGARPLSDLKPGRTWEHPLPSARP